MLDTIKKVFIYDLYGQRGRLKNCVRYLPKMRHNVLVINIFLALTLSMVLAQKFHMDYLINLNDHPMEEVNIHILTF